MKKLTAPAFSLIRLKKSLPLYDSCSKEMISYLNTQSDRDIDVDCIEMIKCCTINTLARVGFGMNINTFMDRENELKKNADNLFDMLRFTMILFVPKVMSFFKIPFFPQKATNFIEGVVEKNIKSRDSEVSNRKDILGTLVKTHKEHPEDMTKHILSKTALQFMADGYTTTAEQIICTLFFIVVNHNVEEKLREEIDRVLDAKEDPNGDLTEDDINELKYLDMVFKESMRIAAFGGLPRYCTKSWKIPGSDFLIRKGTTIVIPVSSLQKDPEYWDDPEEFIPERFSEENKGKIRSGTFFPFGQGPRICLGNSYARILATVMITHIIRNFTFEGQDKLPRKLKCGPESFLGPEGGLSIKFKKRDL